MTPSLVLGILGGGQLGRMSAMAAARLGIQTHIYTPEENSPAAQVSAQTTVADYTDENALKAFATAVDVITYEFENIPTAAIQFLKKITPVYPDENLLDISQDRISEKSFLNTIGIPTTRFEKYETEQQVSEVFETWKTDELIIKTTRFGYDGKGQIKLHKNENIAKEIESLNGDLIIEDIVNFDYEISVIIARNSSGDIQTYGPMRNEHKNHILHKTHYPGDIPADIQKDAISLVRKLAEHIELIGILTLELFVTKDGSLLANEIAPRTHNSGHWTIDACTCSQFENHVRAVCNLPLGDAQPHTGATMLNLIGNDIENIGQYYIQPHTAVHLYGKSEARAGRKMGHITTITLNASNTDKTTL